jgi:DNA-binding LytR/AlgR family response regulator
VIGMLPQPQIATKRPAPRIQGQKQPSPRVAIKVKGKILFINLSDVVAVQAKGNYVSLRRNGNSYLLRNSISAVAEKLEPQGFIRIHRSILVNASFVEEIRPYSTGEYGLRVKDGKEYTVTRTYKKNLNCLAEFWIGTGAFFPD